MSETTKKPSEHKCPVCEAKKKKQMALNNNYKLLRIKSKNFKRW